MKMGLLLLLLIHWMTVPSRSWRWCTLLSHLHRSKGRPWTTRSASWQSWRVASRIGVFDGAFRVSATEAIPNAMQCRPTAGPIATRGACIANVRTSEQDSELDGHHHDCDCEREQVQQSARKEELRGAGDSERYNNKQG